LEGITSLIYHTNWTKTVTNIYIRWACALLIGFLLPLVSYVAYKAEALLLYSMATSVL